MQPENGSYQVLQQCKYAELGLVERRGPHLRFWTREMSLLAEVTLEEGPVLSQVLDGLRSAGKII